MGLSADYMNKMATGYFLLRCIYSGYRVEMKWSLTGSVPLRRGDVPVAFVVPNRDLDQLHRSVRAHWLADTPGCFLYTFYKIHEVINFV